MRKCGPSIVRDGLVLCLDAANRKSYPGSGSTWYDLSSNKNHANLNGTTFSSSYGGVLVFNGTSDYGVLSSNLDLSYTDKITVEVLYNTSVNNSDDIILEHSTNFNSNNAFGFSTNEVGLGGNGSVLFLDHTNTYNIVYSSQNYNNGNWFCFQGTADRSLNADQSFLYMNGVLDTNHAGYYADLSGNHASFPLYIGARAGSSGFFPGSIAIIRIYDRILSISELTQNFQSHRKRFGI